MYVHIYIYTYSIHDNMYIYTYIYLTYPENTKKAKHRYKQNNQKSHASSFIASYIHLQQIAFFSENQGTKWP